MRIYALILLAFLSVNLSSQDHYLDSISGLLKKASQDTDITRLTLQLGEVLYNDNPDSAITLWKIIVERSAKNLATKRTPFYLHAYSESLSNLGVAYKQRGEITVALEYYQKCMKIQEETRDKEGIANTLSFIGRIQESQGDVPRALENYHKSLKIQEEIRDEAGIARSLSNIGYIYSNQGEIEKALENYERALKLQEKLGNKYEMPYTLSDMGIVCTKKGDNKKALEYYSRALAIMEELGDQRGTANALANVGVAYKFLGQSDKALEAYQRALQIQETIKERGAAANSMNNIADIYLLQNKLGDAQSFANRSLKEARQLGFPVIIKRAANTLKHVYKKQNKFAEALAMYELEVQMGDSINNQQTRKTSIKKELQYQYEKKAAADSVKNAEEQKVKDARLEAQNASLKQERTQRNALYGGLLLIASFLAFVFNRFRVTQKQKKIIEEQKVLVDKAYEHLHEKNKEVMDSIHYARRIQRSLLPTEKYITRSLDKRKH